MDDELKALHDYEIAKLQRAIHDGHIQRATVLWWEDYAIVDIKVGINLAMPVDSITLLLRIDDDDDRLKLSDFDFE
jgi:hypothetical protein